jgi:hypothetical protein
MPEPPPPRRASAWQRLPTGWRLAVTAVAALLVFAAIGLGSTSSPAGGGSRHPALARLEATTLTVFLLWTIAVALALAVWALTAKGGPPLIRRNVAGLSRWQMLALLMTAVAVAFVINSVTHRNGKPSHLPNVPKVRPGQLQPPAKPGPGLVDTRVATVGVVVALALTLLAIIALQWWDRKHRPTIAPLDVRDEADAAALARAIDDALVDLATEPDPRRAVIAAYARMERALRERGVARREWETPTEYLDRVLREFGARAASVDRLTALFQHAKFSHHPVDEGMKREAIVALEQARAGLAVPA